MKKLSKIVAASLVAMFVAFAFVPVPNAASANFTLSDAVGDGGYAHGDGTPDELFGTGGIFTTIINIILFIVGILSVIMLIYGGIRYATSAGESGRVTSAKNTVLYAIVGLIVAILAYAIVNFVITGLID